MKRISLTAAVLASALALGCQKSEEAKTEPAPQTATPETAKAEDLEIKGRRIDIKVTRMGYEPDRVEAKPNEQVTLVFTRVEPTECGREIAVPSLGVKKELPMNQPVAIPVTAGADGEVAFACGMDMMKGALVVQN